jgi:hypothetical protein
MKKGQVGYGKEAKADKKKVPKGSHMMPNGSTMKNSEMKKKKKY